MLVIINGLITYQFTVFINYEVDIYRTTLCFIIYGNLEMKSYDYKISGTVFFLKLITII